MLKSYSFMPKEIDIAFYYDVWQEILKLKWYFYKFAGVNADEAMQRTLIHTLMHFQAEKGNLSAYVKKLAREITKENSKVIYVDFLEQTLSEDGEDEPQATVDTGRVSDFSSEIIEEMMLNESKYDEVAGVALEFMDKFVTLCDALIKHDTSTKYYPETFIAQCLRINKNCNNFNQLCLDIYAEFKEDFDWFLGLTLEEDCVWREADYPYIQNSCSKRVKFINSKTNQVVENADQETWSIVGNLGDGLNRKKIVKVNYYDLWDYMCDLIDASETNEMKFIIQDNYIIRTIGGSLTVLNPDLYNVYDLVRMEIVTNVLQDTNSRLLNIGDENIYILCNSDFQPRTISKNLFGFSFDFNYEDITDTIQ